MPERKHSFFREVFPNTLFILNFDFHRMLESFTTAGELSIIGSNKSYFFTAAGATLERGERGDTAFDVLVVLVQLQYFLSCSSKCHKENWSFCDYFHRWGASLRVQIFKNPKLTRSGTILNSDSQLLHNSYWWARKWKMVALDILKVCWCLTWRNLTWRLEEGVGGG